MKGKPMEVYSWNWKFLIVVPIADLTYSSFAKILEMLATFSQKFRYNKKILLWPEVQKNCNM